MCETALKTAMDSRGDVSQAVGVIGKLRLSWMTVMLCLSFSFFEVAITYTCLTEDYFCVYDCAYVNECV